MKIKEGFMLREVAGVYTVVAVGKASLEFKGVINLNEVGAFLWKCVDNGLDEQGILEKLTSEYDVDENVALQDIRAFIAKLKEKNLVEE